MVLPCLMGAFSYDDTPCLMEFSKFLTDRASTRFANLRPGSMRNFEHLVSLLNAKFFYTEVKLSLAEQVADASTQGKT